MWAPLESAKGRLESRVELRARSEAVKLVGRSAPVGWLSYRDLHRSSPALAGISLGEVPASVNLLLPSLSERTIFAGVRTALVFGARYASTAGLPLRVLYFGPPMNAAKAERIVRVISEMTGLGKDEVSVRSLWKTSDTVFSHSDKWIATYWSTAHALDVACKLERISPSQVIYLVQDYEPGFFPGSTQSALCRATYHAGFTLVVNSSPLKDYLERRESLNLDSGLVFRPELDTKGLAHAAESRVPREVVRIAFYGRPSKPRNSFELGVAALRVASRLLRDSGIPVEFVSVGEAHPAVALGEGTFRSVGKLGWAEYFDFLASTDVMFSLQQTPHPSHLPLDAVASGGFAVTNDFEGTRSNLSRRLIATSDDPDALGRGILRAVQLTLSGEALPRFDNDFVESLGQPLERVVARVAGRA